MVPSCKLPCIVMNDKHNREVVWLLSRQMNNLVSVIEVYDFSRVFLIEEARNLAWFFLASVAKDRK